MNATTRFRITAPFNERRQIPKLKAAGAHELYCGFVDSESEKLWPAAFCLVNRRGQGSSFETLAGLREALRQADDNGLPVYVAFNGQYTPEQHPWLLRTIEKISSLRGLEGLIVSDIPLLLTLQQQEYDKKICISTEGTTFNALTLDFYRSLGASRVILDRQLTAGELADLCNKRLNTVGLEIFIFHTACLFVDGFCSFFHCRDKGERAALDENTGLTERYYTAYENYLGCHTFRAMLARANVSLYDRRGGSATGVEYDNDKYPSGCNLCALFALKNFTEITLKVVGRGEKQYKTVGMVSRALELLRSPGVTAKRYKQQVQELFFETTKKKCSGFECYCPTRLIRGQ